MLPRTSFALSLSLRARGERCLSPEARTLATSRRSPPYLTARAHHLGRLSTLVRGVGDPTVAVYCRCFVAAAGAKVAPWETDHLAGSVQDYLFRLQVLTAVRAVGSLKVRVTAATVGISTRGTAPLFACRREAPSGAHRGKK